MYGEVKKAKGVSVNPSELGSWIIESYSKSSFKKQQARIEKEFINFRKLVRDNLSGSASQEELLQSLKGSLAAAARTPKVKEPNDNKTVPAKTVDDLKSK